MQVPQRARGYLFEYELAEVTSSGASIKYTERIYKPGSDSFEYFKETEEVQLMSFPLSSIDESHELWSKALGHTNAVAFVERERMEKIAKATVVSSEDAIGNFDMKDIDEMFTKEGKGPLLLEMDFKPDTPTWIPYINTKGENSAYWHWSHKLTGKSLKRFQAKTGKSFDTGKLSKYLKVLAKDTSHPLAAARAKKFLSYMGYC